MARQQHIILGDHQDPKRLELDIAFDRLLSASTPGSAEALRQIPRRKFKKSTKGCRTCKERKVKCDEKRPLCGNCLRRFPGMKACNFEGLVAISRKSHDGSWRNFPQPNHQIRLAPSVTTHPTGTSDAEGLRVLELRLMHHYTTSTCNYLPDGQSLMANYVWSIDIPRLAFQSELVLSALLGIAALHHWALNPDDPKIFYAAGFYFDKAVRTHRKALSEADKASAESVLATAILITHYAWLAAHSNISNSSYELPLQTYHMARGIQILFDQMWPWLNGSGYLWYVDRMPNAVAREETCTDEFYLSCQEDLTLLSKTFKEGDVSPNDKIVYEKTVEDLSSMCLAICNSVSGTQVPLQRLIATMPLRLPERFLQLLELNDPRALALLARNLSFLNVIDSVWWLHGTGPSQNVAERAASGIRKMMPAEWVWVMEWPLKVTFGDLRPSHRGIREDNQVSDFTSRDTAGRKSSSLII